MLKHCEEVEAARVEATKRLAELERSSDAREAALAAAEATTEDLKAGAALQTTAVAELSGKLAAAKARRILLTDVGRRSLRRSIWG